MRFISKSRPGVNRSRSNSYKTTPNPSLFNQHHLYVKINANSAADLVQPLANTSNNNSDDPSAKQAAVLKKNVNPVLVASINTSKKKTSRKLNTNNPSWDDSLLLPLRPNDHSSILTLSVWDKNKSAKVYLGEVRFNIKDIFLKEDGFISSTDVRWYKLYSNKVSHSFVTGSLLLSFELIVKKRKSKKTHNKRKSQQLDVDEVGVPGSSLCTSGGETPAENGINFNNNIVVKVEPPPDQLNAANLNHKLENLHIPDSDTIPIDSLDSTKSLFAAWIDSLIYPDPSPNSIQPDDQGFYSDSNFEATNAVADLSDLESVDHNSNHSRSRSGSNASSRTKIESPVTFVTDKHSTPHQPILMHHTNKTNSSSQLLSVTPPEDDLGSFSDGSVLSSESAVNSDLYSDKDPFAEASTPDPKAKKKRLRKKSNKKHENFAVKNRKVLGVLFLEIVSCSDLPPVRNRTRTSFDMDPFIVVTFGKKTFRTSWKRHTLSPIFNERLAFEVMSHESNFNVQFSVLDKDHFSFHDKVADISISMKDLKELATQPQQRENASGDEYDSAYATTPPPSNGSTPRPILMSSHLTNSPLHQSAASLPNTTSVAGEKTRPSHTPTSSYSNNGSLSDVERDIQKKGIRILEDDNVVESLKKKKFMKRKKVSLSYADTSNFKTMNLSLSLHDSKLVGKYNPVLKVRARFQPYDSLRRQFWKILLDQYNFNETPGRFDYIELISLLDTLGCEKSDEIVTGFFQKYERSMWGGDVMREDEIIDCLEEHVLSTDKQEDKIFEIEKCPICYQKKLSRKLDIDIITHVAICASKDWSIVNKLLVSSYVTPQAATKRWFSKVLIKLTYGKYKLGSNSANILVQDRTTGIIMEEKMGVYVRLGIRLLYKGLDKAKTKRVRSLLKKLSVKQGIKFDHPLSANDIESFIKFHKLDLSECLISDPTRFETFNDFFYRKLKPGARPNESPEDNRVVVSPADCRCTTFDTVDVATDLWIKGRNFTLAKLFNGNFNNLQDTDLFKPGKCSLGIFRLAPQDYHRFHSPVEGKIKSIKYIEGEYYTVNPMAIRSDLDVFGENVRVLIAIETEAFGTVIMVAVGAMMVGSTILSVNEGDSIKRGDEVGYFKFGGSTIVLIFERSKFQFDSDLLDNSKSCVETLIRVGQSIGHSPQIKELERDHIDFGKQSKEFKMNLIRVLTGGDLNDSNELSNWESSNIKLTNDDIEKLIKTTDGSGYAEDEEENDDDIDDLSDEASIESHGA